MSHNVVESRSSMFACFDVKRHKQLVSDHLIQVKVKQISFFQPSSDDDALFMNWKSIPSRADRVARGSQTPRERKHAKRGLIESDSPS